MLISCQPQVQLVPCCELSTYVWPTSSPPPPPPPTASYSNREISLARRPYDVPVDDYMSTDLQYVPEPNVGAVASIWKNGAAVNLKEPSPSRDQHTDSGPNVGVSLDGEFPLEPLGKHDYYVRIKISIKATPIGPSVTDIYCGGFIIQKHFVSIYYIC